MSPLRDSLEDYLALRRALGTRLAEPGMALSAFVGFLEAEGLDHITTASAVRWARQPEWAQPATWARKLTAVRGFASWLSADDSRTEVPANGILVERHRRKPPHIYSPQEIRRLMWHARRLPSRTGLRARTYATVIGLLASTGLRSGEVLALDIGDVDLGTGILAIRDSKFGKSRLVPVSPTTGRALARYSRFRDRAAPQRGTQAFFVAERGMRLTGSAARRTFARLCAEAGLRPTVRQRSGHGPRLHDIRHTFATTKLIEWYRAGLDVDREIPKLTTYLGHSEVGNTYWYIEAVPELLQLATERLSARRSGDRR
jgi:integrase